MKAKFKPKIIDGKPVGTKVVIVYKIISVDSQNKRKDLPEITWGKAVKLYKPPCPSSWECNLKQVEKVLIKAEINEEGFVTSAEAISGHPLLKVASVQAARYSKFLPTFQNGKPVKSTAEILYEFLPGDKVGTEVEVISIKLKIVTVDLFR